MGGESDGLGRGAGALGRGRRKRLLERVHEAIRRCHYSRRTEEAYVIKRFVWFSGKRHPRELVPDIEADRALIPISGAA
jgi:hypothetical protein